MSVTTIRLPEALSKKLDQLAEQTQHSRSWLINQAVMEYVARTHTDAERWQETLEALESVKAGREIEGKKGDAMLSGWGGAAKTQSRG